MARSIRVAGKLLCLGLLSGALALPLVALATPLGAEEVTVTIPPDDPPAQEQPAHQGFDPTAHPTDDAPMPNSSAQAEPAPEQSAPAEQAPEASPPTPPAAAEAPAGDAPPAAAEATPATPPVVKKAHKKVKKAAAPEAPANGAAEAPAAAKPAKKKTASAKASCLNLTEEKCGGNTACVWVAAGTNDAGKATTARCRSLAILKRETDKAAKAAKAKGPEVLPWAANGGATTASTSTTAAAEAKPAKKKTVSAKKAKPKPAEAEAPPVVPSSSDASGASGAD